MWTLRKRIRNKTSLPQCIILATRSMGFRVQFHKGTQIKPARLLERAIPLSWLCPSPHRKIIGLTLKNFFFFFNCSLIAMGLHRVSWLGCAGPQALVPGPGRQQESAAAAAEVPGPPRAGAPVPWLLLARPGDAPVSRRGLRPAEGISHAGAPTGLLLLCSQSL